MGNSIRRSQRQGESAVQNQIFRIFQSVWNLEERSAKVFLPEDGYVFLDADYSQIELRVLAHLSQDEKLIHAYEENQDIHARTASEVFGIPMDEVTSTQRRDAKSG